MYRDPKKMPLGGMRCAWLAHIILADIALSTMAPFVLSLWFHQGSIKSLRLRFYHHCRETNPENFQYMRVLTVRPKSLGRCFTAVVIPVSACRSKGPQDRDLACRPDKIINDRSTGA